jgi:hypothetical protein
MATSPEQSADERPRATAWPPWLAEAGGGVLLAVLLAYVLRVSWRRWPDPIIDSGQQWYAAWRIAGGGMLFHEGAWNYGPLSAYANGWLFKIFGASLTVLFTANLLIYGGILALAYCAFRRGWGRLGAFSACAVFISVFSFSHLTSVGNYNYAAPYAHEVAHGMLLILLTLFAAASWCRARSLPLAFALGTCGGLAAVLKPEFMLAAAVLGLAALSLRLVQRAPVAGLEWALLAAGVVWPTFAFAFGFAASESFAIAFSHACNAWWRVVVNPVGVAGFAAGQSRFAGFDRPWRNGWLELSAGLYAALVIGVTWAAGWLINRPGSAARLYGAAALISVALALCAYIKDGWNHVGLCLPLLTVAGVVFYGIQLRNQLHRTGRLEPDAVMRCLMLLLAAAMLARMALFARVYHFGFFQAALAGMAVAAIMVHTVPQWTGAGWLGRGCAALSGLLALILVCGSIAARSNFIRGGQTQPVGAGADRFYVFERDLDTTGALVDWVVKKMDGSPPTATLLVLPDGLSVNFLARRISPLPDVGAGGPEALLVERLRKSPPDYVALISLDLTEHGIRQFGAPGNFGELLLPWVKQNYSPVASWGDPYSGARMRGAAVLRRNP